jgi:large subunit ribosomal protein L34e
MKDSRFKYDRRHTYRTRSNRLRPVKTPGGRLIGRVIEKQAHRPSCGDCGRRTMHGIPALRRQDMANKRTMSVNRSYGGSRCAKCVRDRIMRAFLEEERKSTKKILQEKKTKA